MLILGFETANFGASFALMQGQDLVGGKSFPQSHGQAGFLIPEIQNFLLEKGVAWSDIQAFVTTTGPGSFTGVRLALAMAKALKSASQVPVLGIPTPEWSVHGFLKNPPPTFLDCPDLSDQHRTLLPILVCLEARREDVYCQLFNPLGQPLKDVVNGSPQDLLSYTGGPAYVIGNGLARLKNQKTPEEGLILWDIDEKVEDLCVLAQDLIQEGKESAYPLTPLYVRPPDTGPPKKKTTSKA